MYRTRLPVFVLAIALLVSATLTGGVQASHLWSTEFAALYEVPPAEVPVAQVGPAVTPKKKGGNGFVRALGAPFRALAKLFGGGKRKPVDTAKAKNQKTATVVAVATPTVPAPVTQSTATPEPHSRLAASARQSSPPRDLPSPPAPPPAPDKGTNQAASVPDTGGRPPDRFTPVVEGVARDPLSQGGALLENGLADQAIAELSIAAVTGPNFLDANNLLGLALDRLGRHGEAREAYERALSVAPGDATTLNHLGLSFHLDNQPQEALKRLKQAARRAPANAGIARNLALVYGQLGKYEDAYKSLTRGFGEFAARLQVATMLETAGRDREAIKHLEAARRLQPASLPTLERLALLYERAGRGGDAEAARQEISTSPDNPSMKSVATKEN